MSQDSVPNESNETSGKRVSSDPLAYARYVRYLRRGHPPCEEILKRVASRQDVVVQDVSQMEPAARPRWLVGVPSLVELPSYALLTGTNALNAIKERTCDEIKGVDSFSRGFSAPGALLWEGGGDEESHLSGAYHGRVESSFSTDDHEPENNGRQGGVDSKQSTGPALEELIRRRNAGSNVKGF